ncbi:MAG: hypothetical protein GYA51_00830 [Candidatus Methanofastidiosa archaeon]|nr:hypothetical protein [Candidatus Methanofastidiosa archaeon]
MKIICQICNREFSRLSDLSKHVGVFHNSQKDYYDLYLKSPDEGICAECGNPTKYSNKWQRGYLKYCSQECENKGSFKEFEKTNLIKYGVNNPNKIKSVRNKIKQTNIKKYGNSCPMQNDKIQNEIRNNNLKNLGVELPFQSKEIQEKSSLIREQKYGAKYTLQNRELYNKVKSSINKKYGCDYLMQNTVLFEKAFKTRIKLKSYKNTELLYQGSYELDFLEKYYDKFNIQRGPSIKYKHNKKQKIYHSDFLIPSKNLIVECKNSYLAKRDKNILIKKKKASLREGFKWIMIIDKNYSKFEKIID